MSVSDNQCFLFSSVRSSRSHIIRLFSPKFFQALNFHQSSSKLQATVSALYSHSLCSQKLSLNFISDRRSLKYLVFLELAWVKGNLKGLLGILAIIPPPLPQTILRCQTILILAKVRLSTSSISNLAMWTGLLYLELRSRICFTSCLALDTSSSCTTSELAQNTKQHSVDAISGIKERWLHPSKHFYTNMDNFIVPAV